jgi:hypothetical protein
MTAVTESRSRGAYRSPKTMLAAVVLAYVSAAAQAQELGTFDPTRLAPPADRPLSAENPADLAVSRDIENYKRYPVDIPSSWAALADDPATRRAENKQENREDAADAKGRKSYLIPALEILGFQALLNRADKLIYGCCDYDVSVGSIRRNLRSSWVNDNDPYAINQLGHPYQGSMYHGFARSSGLNYWEALGYTLAGSAVWEIAGETTRPSKNDQITTGVGGTFLGEALFRMSHLLLDSTMIPRPWRDLAATAVSPPTGFNRLVFDNRFDGLFASRNPAHYSRLQIGAANATQNQPGTATGVKRTEGIVDFSLEYGLPGKPGYAYTRPFDYFSFQAIASTANTVDSVLTRGVLLGTDYDLGNNYRGVWGLYGSYDYIAPQTFRVSSTALSLGTTAEWWLSKALAMQYTATLGAGYASVGTINGLRDQDYHNGIAPQALLAMRLIYADRAALEITGREYFVSSVAADRTGRGGHDNIARADVSFSWRVYKQHAVSIRYQRSRRDATYPVIGDRSQDRTTVGIFYTLLGREGFSAADWRK